MHYGKIKALTIFLLINNILMGMYPGLLRPKPVMMRPLPESVVYLIPYPESVKSLDEWKDTHKNSYIRIPMPLGIAEKSEYIKLAHKIRKKKEESKFQLPLPEGLNHQEDIFIQTDDEEGIEACVKLYTQEEKGQKVDLSGEELIRLLSSEMIGFLQLPQPKTDLEELFIEKIKQNPSEGMGFSLTGIEFDEAIAKDMIKTILNRQGCLFSEIIAPYFKSLEYGRLLIGNQSALFVKPNEKMRRKDLLYFDGKTKVYGGISTDAPSDENYDNIIIVNEHQRKVISLSGQNSLQKVEENFFRKRGSVTVIPNKTKQFYLMTAKYVSANKLKCDSLMMDSESSKFSVLYDGGTGCCFYNDNELYSFTAMGLLKYNLVSGIPLRFEEAENIFFGEEKSFYDGPSLKRDKVIQLLCKEGDEYKNPMFFCVTEERIYCLVDKEGNLQVNMINPWRDGEDGIIISAHLNEEQSKMLVTTYVKKEDYKGFQEKSTVKWLPYFHIYDIDQENIIKSYTTPHTWNEKLSTKLETILVGEGDLMIAYNTDDQGHVRIHFDAPHVGDWVLDMRSQGKAINTPDGKNIIIDTAKSEASSIPLYDDSSLELLKYLNVNKTFENITYNQRLDGMLLLCALCGDRDQGITIKQQVVDTCFPELVKKMVKGMIKSRFMVKKPAVDIKREPENVVSDESKSAKQSSQQQEVAQVKPQGWFSSFTNYTSAAYNSVKQKMSDYKKQWLVGASALGLAVGAAAAHRYLSNK